jgi:hypothetical protein
LSSSFFSLLRPRPAKFEKFDFISGLAEGDVACAIGILCTGTDGGLACTGLCKALPPSDDEVVTELMKELDMFPDEGIACGVVCLETPLGVPFPGSTVVPAWGDIPNMEVPADVPDRSALDVVLCLVGTPLPPV